MGYFLLFIGVAVVVMFFPIMLFRSRQMNQLVWNGELNHQMFWKMSLTIGCLIIGGLLTFYLLRLLGY